jgi:hypothetical protein
MHPSRPVVRPDSSDMLQCRIRRNIAYGATPSTSLSGRSTARRVAPTGGSKDMPVLPSVATDGNPLQQARGRVKLLRIAYP